MIWIFLGPPGAGKGTQAVLMAEDLGVAHVSTGALLRSAVRADTELGRIAKGYMMKGELVPDELLLGLVRETLEGPARKGCILDGYPRNAHQAESLDGMVAGMGRRIEGVIDLEVHEETLVARISGRARAEGRADDTEETVRNRLRVYREQTRPLIEFYRGRGLLNVIDGEGTIDEIRARIRRVVADGAGPDRAGPSGEGGR